MEKSRGSPHHDEKNADSFKAPSERPPRPVPVLKSPSVRVIVSLGGGSGAGSGGSSGAWDHRTILDGHLPQEPFGTEEPAARMNLSHYQSPEMTRPRCTILGLDQSLFESLD